MGYSIDHYIGYGINLGDSQEGYSLGEFWESDTFEQDQRTKEYDESYPKLEKIIAEDYPNLTTEMAGDSTFETIGIVLAEGTLTSGSQDRTEPTDEQKAQLKAFSEHFGTAEATWIDWPHSSGK